MTRTGRDACSNLQARGRSAARIEVRRMSERELTGMIVVGYYGLDWKPQKKSDPIWIGPKWLSDVIVGHLAKHYCQRKPGTLSEENAVRYQWFESVLVSEAWEPH